MAKQINPGAVPSINSPLADPVTGQLSQPWYQYFIGLGLLNSLISFGPGIPTRGTFQRGAIIFNSLPAVGQPKSWVCTVTGTPGTWVSQGNL